ncbi:hypothetical protein GSB9_00077 [Flavobacteriaceae bacterium GSB9]|nr:hypothetical protein GSB9_00077 [Flavobacteriaceae bacterium GSB9]
MKYFKLILFVLTSCIISGQSNCDTASSYLVNAYSHVKDSYESNNISHLKYYANRSLESFKLSKENLTQCGCTKSFELADKSIDLLAHVEQAETYEDGRFYVKRAKELAQKSIVELDKFTAYANKVEKLPSNEELILLELKQQALKEQQLALQQKEKEIKQKFAEQRANLLQKEKEKLIKDYKTIIASSIDTYNKSLQVCNCNEKLTDDKSNYTSLKLGDIAEIKKQYLSHLKSITATYLNRLDNCGNQ